MIIVLALIEPKDFQYEIYNFTKKLKSLVSSIIELNVSAN